LGADVVLIDPYNGEYMAFETEAYGAFMANIGLNKYCDLLQSKLEKTAPPMMLTGFSLSAWIHEYAFKKNNQPGYTQYVDWLGQR
jgi:hypothetical protein